MVEDYSIPSAASFDFLLAAETMLPLMIIKDPMIAAAINIDKIANLVCLLLISESQY